MFEGWDDVPENEYCECHKPDFDKSGTCKICEKQLKGITLDVKNASITITPVMRPPAKTGDTNG